jgi:hypothetical protein
VCHDETITQYFIVSSDFIQPENFPEHLKLALQRLKDREEQEIRQRELDKSTCKVKSQNCRFQTNEGKPCA